MFKITRIHCSTAYRHSEFLAYMDTYMYILTCILVRVYNILVIKKLHVYTQCGYSSVFFVFIFMYIHMNTVNVHVHCVPTHLPIHVHVLLLAFMFKSFFSVYIVLQWCRESEVLPAPQYLYCRKVSLHIDVCTCTFVYIMHMQVKV